MSNIEISDKQTIGMIGRYKIWKNDELVYDGENMILDGCISRMCSGSLGENFRLYCGSDATPSTPTMLGIQSFISGSMSSNYTWGNRNVSRNYGGWNVYAGEYRDIVYTAGTFTGTVRELGVRMHTSSTQATSNGDVVDTRIVPSDANGNPIDIVIGATDSLSVRFEILFTAPQPFSRVFNFRGTDHKITWTPLSFTNTGSNSLYNRTARTWQGYSGNNNGMRFWGGSNVSPPSSPLNADPSGGTPELVDDGLSTVSIIGSTANTFTTQTTFTISNFSAIASFLSANGISAVGFNATTAGCYIIEPQLPPSTVLSATFTFSRTWTVARGSVIEQSETETFVATMSPVTTVTESAPNGAYTTDETLSVGITGGKPPFTWSWARVSGDTILSADNASGSYTTFSGTGTSQTANEVWRCTVTDSASATATADVTLAITWS